MEKFIGDAVMAVWGTPVAREDDAERAVRAGLGLVDAVAAFGEEVGAAGLRARAGVVTGQVAAMANDGEGLVVGDRVNTASRVQSIAEPGSLLVDEVTRQVTASAIAYADAGEHMVKGKAEPLRLFRAERVVAGVAGSQRAGGLEVAFTGRDSELRLVKELFHAAVDRGTARLVAVSGAPGVGKSRLRDEFENYCDGLADTVLWHSGRSLAYGEGVAYWALAEMVRQRLGIAEDEPPADAATKLDRGLERWMSDPGERAFVAPRLGALLGVSDAALDREELFAGWRLFFERLASEHPVVLAFEDLQWADARLLDFIDHLLDWSAQSRIFILALARPELAERREGWATRRRGATSIYLDPLADGAMAELLDGLVVGLPRAARDRIVAQAEGIPLYAIETVRALADSGAVASNGDRLELVGELGALDVPASLSSLLAARLDALDADEREVVRAMAVFGGTFPRTAVAALADVAPDRLDDVLSSLVRKEVLGIRADRLSPDRGHYAFAQTLLRTVAHDMLSKRERKPRHLAAAAHLRSAFPDDGEEVAEVLAAHLLEAYRAAPDDPDAGGLRAEALAALRRSGARAAGVGAPEAAERAYRTAAELAEDDDERIELQATAAEMALHAGRSAVALELLTDATAAYERAGRPRDAARLGPLVGLALRDQNRLEDAVAATRAALDVLGPEELDPGVAAVGVEHAVAVLYSGHPAEAAAPLETALRIAEALELPEVLARAMGAKATMYGYVGRPREARTLYEGAVEIAEQHGFNREFARALGNLGDTHLRWDIAGGLERTEQALAAARRLGDRILESIAACNVILAQMLRGGWDEAVRTDAELVGDREQRPGVEMLDQRLSILHALRGESAAGRRRLASMAPWKDGEDPERRGMYAASAAALALAEGRPEEALELAAGTARWSHANEGGAGEALRQAWPDAVDAAVAAGRDDAVAELVAMLDPEPPGRVPPFLRAQLRRARGLLAGRGGDDAVAERELRAAIAGFAALEFPYWEARAQLDFAGWLLDHGRGEEAAPLLHDATAVFSRLGAAPALGRARELAADLPAAVAV